MAYDSPNAMVKREINISNLAITSSASKAKYIIFQKSRLIAVHCLVGTAGTNASAGIDIYVGTDSVGALTYGTNMAGVVVDAAISAAIPADSYIEIKGKASSEATVSLAIEYQATGDA